jgi:hypothetical protein
MESGSQTFEGADSSSGESDDLNSNRQVPQLQIHRPDQAAVTCAATERLTYWQQEINQNVKGSYYLVGRALYQVLYVEKLLNSRAFVPWVKKTFGLTRSTAYEYVRAYRVVELLQTVDPTLPVPSTLSHFRVFNKCKLEADEVVGVWRRVLESIPAGCQRLTAKVVIASRKEAVTSEESSRRPSSSCSEDYSQVSTDSATSDASIDSPVAKRKKIASSGDTREPLYESVTPDSVPQYVTMDMLTAMVKECQKSTFCRTGFDDAEWPEILYVNLVALFPNDIGFRDQAAFMEKALQRFEAGLMKRGIFIVQLAFYSPSFIRLLGYPHCYLKPLAVPDTDCGGNEATAQVPTSTGVVLKQCAAIYIGKYAEKFVQVFSRFGVVPGVNSWAL